MLNLSKFWYNLNLLNFVLIPFSYLYSFGYFVYKILNQEKKIEIPVICVGNIVVGGSGKTPITIKLRELLSKNFKNIFVLTKGYRGKFRGPKIIKRDDDFFNVGDESLLHCSHGKTCMSKNKLLGANFCMKNKADLIIMDDGLQSKDIKKDFKILIIDGDYEFGNNLLFPAGPLRQSLNEILSEVDLIIIIGTYKKSFTKILKNRKIFCAKKIIELNCKNKNLFAFSGLGNNSNFFNLIKKSDYKLQRIKEFSDHHFYKNSEIESMISEAEKANLQLVCTMKDYLKIDEQFKSKIYPVQMKIDIKNERDLLRNIIKTLSN